MKLSLSDQIIPLPAFEGEGVDAGAEDVKQEAVAAAAKAEAANPSGDDGDKGDAAGRVKTALEVEDGKAPTPAAPDPEEWRKEIAGGDKDLAKLLDRFKTPDALGKTLKEQSRLLRTGVREIPMPDGEKDPEGLKKWREEHGVPESSDKYELADDIKKVVTDEDKPLVDGALEHFHALGWDNKNINEMLGFYFGLQQATVADQEKADKQLSEEVRDTLVEEWGTRYKDQSGLARQFATEITPGIDWFTARMPDGRALGNIPEVVMALAKLGEKEYGDMHYAGSENETRTNSREEELRTIMKSDIRQWRANPKLRDELQSIVEAKQKRAGR